MLTADEEDVAAVLAGDVDRFERIVDRWKGPLVNLAWRFVRDEAIAEDFAQEAFLKCYRSLRQWRGEARFSSWLFSVALSVYRSRMRRIEPVRQALQDVIDDRASAQQRLEQSEEAVAVRRAVDSLPPLYRDPIVVFYFQEQDLAASARVLGMREGTLKARLHRARKALRAILSKESR